MGSRRLWIWAAVMVVVMSWRLAGVAGQGCNSQNMPGLCKCEIDQQGRYIVKCSCRPGQNMVLSSMGNTVPPHTSDFQVSKCEGSVTVEEEAFSELHYLEKITFHSLANLTLHSWSINPDFFAQEQFTLTLESISALAFEEDAIDFDAEELHIQMVIQNSTITKLPKHAIIASMGEFRLKHVTLQQTPEPHSIDIGIEGAEVYIDTIDTTTGLGPEWMIGNVTKLSITNSNLILQPQAFSAVQFLTLNSSLTIRGNQFGLPMSSQGINPPSLPKNALDLITPSGDILIDASENYVTCRCEDLVWLLELPSNQLKQKVQASLKCKSGNVISALANCKPVINQASYLGPAPSSLLMLAPAFLLTLLLTA